MVRQGVGSGIEGDSKQTLIEALAVIHTGSMVFRLPAH
jgi:hypothetical protein